MLEDVDQCAERIADVESAYAPSLTLRTVLDREFSRSHPRENLVKIVNFNREVRNRRTGTSLSGYADLNDYR